MQTVEVRLDEENELVFGLEIESTDSVAKPSVRLVCEGNNISYSFKGEILGEEAKFIVPPMDGILRDGEYSTKLEVFVGNKYFVPLEFKAEFAKSVKVVAEIRNAKTKKKDVVKASLRTDEKSKKKISEDLQAKKRDALRKKKLADRAAKKKQLEEAANKRKLQEAALKRKETLLKKKLAEKARRRKLAEQKKSKSKSPDDELRSLLEQALYED